MMKRRTKQKFVVVLGVLVLFALLATSIVSARRLARPLVEDHMMAPLTTIPGGSINSSYWGDYVTSGEHDIPLYTGWTTNLPIGVCAITARLVYKADEADEYAVLRPVEEGGWPVQTPTQVANIYNSSTGIVPITGGNPVVQLFLTHAGYVCIEITGYWMCDDYVRPTPEP